MDQTIQILIVVNIVYGVMIAALIFAMSRYQDNQNHVTRELLSVMTNILNESSDLISQLKRTNERVNDLSKQVKQKDAKKQYTSNHAPRDDKVSHNYKNYGSFNPCAQSNTEDCKNVTIKSTIDNQNSQTGDL